jgi:hypothetical protein
MITFLTSDAGTVVVVVWGVVLPVDFLHCRIAVGQVFAGDFIRRRSGGSGGDDGDQRWDWPSVPRGKCMCLLAVVVERFKSRRYMNMEQEEG